LFLKFLKNCKFVIEEIVPNKETNERNRMHGATIYTPDFSVVKDFKRVKLFENHSNPYNKETSFSADYRGREITSFFSDIEVGGIKLDKYNIVLRNQEMSLNEYDLVLKGKHSWEGGYSKDENETYLKIGEKKIKYFKEKGMQEKLLKKIEHYIKWWAAGLDPDEEDPRK